MNLCIRFSRVPHYFSYLTKSNSANKLVSANYSSTVDSSELIFSEKNSKSSSQKADNISRAMIYYLEKLNDREKLIKFKAEEFEIGKRHLAKMMGENVDTFNQADIDRAISYLLPSGLFEKKARPFLRHPEDYYPKSKIAAFNKDGRPLSHLFYTGNSEFYQLIYETTQKLINLKKLEDVVYLVKSKVRISKSRDSDTNAKYDLTGSVWMNRLDLSKKLNANINEANYAKFLVLIQKLADHPMSKREEDYLKQFLIPFVPPIKLSEIPALLVDEKGRSYQEVETMQRNASIKLRLYEGTGNIKIKSPTEGEFNIMYFQSITHREQILMPFKVVDRINKYDMEVEVNTGGMSCLAKGIRFCVSKALCSFVSTDAIEKLRLAGLLTKDSRFKERKKPGQEGARRRYTWKKR